MNFGIKKILLLALILMLFSSVMMATTLICVEDGFDADYNDACISMNNASVSSSTGTWQSIVTPNGLGGQFWNVPTLLDGLGKNPGNFANATSAFVGNPNSPGWSVSDTQFFGIGNGPAPLVFSRTGGDVDVSLILEVSSISALNSWYWAPASNTSLLNLIIAGASSPVMNVTFSPTQDFVLVMQNFVRTVNSSSNPDYFVAFQKHSNDGDIGQVPELSTYAMLSIGLICIILVRRY